MRKSIFLFLFSLILASQNCFAQQGYFWNDLVDWDGVTNWAEYIIISPGYLGPNALPVPEADDGLIGHGIKLKTALDLHFMKGDRTQNLFLQFSHPFWNNNISVGFSVVPVEHYRLDHNIRDERRARHSDPEAFGGGDFYFWTNVQLIKNAPKLPDILFGMYCRTASGGNLADARFTDAPGYYFNLSFGKSFYNNAEKNTDLRWYGMIGFYCWQTNINYYAQNDAGLFAGGVKLKWHKIIINNSASGYIGYIGMKNWVMFPNSDKPQTYQKDQPVVYRFDFLRTSGKFDYGIRFQKGLHDFGYSTVRISLTYQFD
jgi:hypothetical protein